MLIGKIDTGYDDNAKNYNTTGWDILYFVQNENVSKKHKYWSIMYDNCFHDKNKKQGQFENKNITIKGEHASIC